jgi:UDP-N-acetylglucosamine 2-epimerase
LVFKKPCILLREKTERQEGLSTGINFLTGLNIEEAKKIIGIIEKDSINIKKIINPYGNIGLSKKIIEKLK